MTEIVKLRWRVELEGRMLAMYPDTMLYHFELSTREAQVSPWEDDLLRRRWSRVTHPDPFSNEDLLRTFAEVQQPTRV